MGFGNMDSLDVILSQVGRLYHYRTQMLLGGYGIYPGQPPILFLLWQEDGLSQKEIARRLKLKPSTVTVMLQRMEKTALLRRCPDAEDLRVSRVYLTAKGQGLERKVQAVFQSIEEECFQGFTPEEKNLLKGFLTSVRDNLQKSVQQNPDIE